MDYCTVLVAFDNKDEVNKSINKLLEEHLISAGQIVNSESKWRWNGEIEMSDEYLVFLKTKKSLLKEIYDIIRSIHSYDCFEFSVFDMASPNKDYLDWIDRETK